MRIITLILHEKNSGKEEEFTYFCCARISRTILMDLYVLYTHVDNNKILQNGLVGDVNNLFVDKIVDPELWLHCLKWTKYKRVANDFKSMEWFIARPKKSGFYYSLGDDGTLLVSRDNPNDTIQIQKETVETFSGESANFCNNPILERIDWNKFNFNEE